MSRRNKVKKSKYFKDDDDYEEDSGSDDSGGLKSGEDSDGIDKSNIISGGRARRARAQVNYSKFFDGGDEEDEDVTAPSDKDESDFSASDGSDAKKTKKKAKQKAKTPAKKKAKGKTESKATSLKDRLKRLKQGTFKPKAKDESDQEEEAEAAPSPPKRKRAKRVVLDSDDEDPPFEDVSDSDEASPPAKKQRKPPKKQNKKVESSDEDDSPSKPKPKAKLVKKEPSASQGKKRALPSFLKKAKESPKKPAKRAKTATPKKKTDAPKKKSGGKKEMPPGSDDPHENFNEKVTSILNDIGKNEKNEGNTYKGLVYFKAARTLKKLPFAVKSGKEAAKYPGIGKSIADKIDEILTTGGLKTLEEAKERPRTKALNELTKVHGIGPKHAQQMFDEHNIKGLDDLSKNTHLLNEVQKIGLKYVKDLQQPIPREECTQLYDYVKKEAAAVDKNIIVVICGSYRRGANQSNDVDFIFTREDWKHGGKRPKEIDEVVERLKNKKFLIADLAHGEHKYMGVCRLPDPDAATKDESKKQESKADIEKKPSPAGLKNRAPTKIAMPNLDSGSDESDDEGAEPPASTNIFLHPEENAAAPEPVEDIPLNAGQTAAPITEEDADGRLARRIDLRFFPHDQYLAALLYFTGPDHFNRNMRQKAQDMGYILNEYGLYKADADGKKIRGQPPEPTSSEKDFFDLLELDYKEPENR